MAEDSTLKFDYELIDHEEYPFAERLAVWIKFHLGGPVMDIGAGTGCYVKACRDVGLGAQGIDTEPYPLRPECVITADLFEFKSESPVVMCIEVAEHIAEEHNEQIVEVLWNSVTPGGTVIFSAAHPGQGGVGHINCQTREYWRQLSYNHGFVSKPYLENNLVNYSVSGYHMGWFPKNCQIWHRPEKPPVEQLMRDLDWLIRTTK
tara:strand:- start:6137 stop:6751 length:615 start_codon:yes stop_codon:yes gene_type:complete